MFPNYSMKKKCFESWTIDLDNMRLMSEKVCF